MCVTRILIAIRRVLNHKFLFAMTNYKNNNDINLVLVHLFLLLIFSSVIEAAFWTQLHENTEDGAPEPVRGEFTANAWNGGIYVYGGCDINFENWLNDTWVFPVEDVAEKGNEDSVRAYKLDTFGEAPPGTCGHGAVVIGDRLYVYGGNGPDGETSALHFLDLRENRWTEVPRSQDQVWPPSRALVQHSLTISGSNTFILVSGISGDVYDDDSAYEFSVIDNTWSKVSEGMAGHKQVGGSAAVTINNRLYVMGGYENRSVIDDLYFLDIGQDKSFKAVVFDDDASPGPLSFQGALSLGEYLIVYGGFSMEAINGDVWVFKGNRDGDDGGWCQLRTSSTKPLPHFAGGWVAVGESLYAFGGRINPTGFHEKLTSDLWRLDDVEVSIQHSCGFS